MIADSPFSDVVAIGRLLFLLDFLRLLEPVSLCRNQSAFERRDAPSELVDAVCFKANTTDGASLPIEQIPDQPGPLPSLMCAALCCGGRP